LATKIKKKALSAFFLFNTPSSEPASIFQAWVPDRINTALRQFIEKNPN
jgi:predicted alpha-1,6-mannanase (GH76 family)